MHFPKNECTYPSAENGHNSACDHYFFMKLAPLDLALTELSLHAKNSIFMKYPEWSLFSEQVTYYGHEPYKKGLYTVPCIPSNHIAYYGTFTSVTRDICHLLDPIRFQYLLVSTRGS